MSLAMAATTFCAAAMLLATSVPTPAQSTDKDEKKEPKRPSLSLKATPGTGMVPVRVTATAEFKGGDDDYQEYYCPTIEWDWGDGTTSQSSADCPPHEPGKSEIRRRFTVEHVFRRPGNFRVAFRLKRHDKAVGSATTQIQVRPGLPEGH